jgi:alkaline phosphatase D
MKLQLLGLLLLVATAAARWSANLNYRSPSEHHPFMGIAIHKVVKRRELDKRFDPAQLNFT